MRVVVGVLALLLSSSATAQVTSDVVLSRYMLGPIDRAGGGWTLGKSFAVPSSRAWTTSGAAAALKVIATDGVTVAGRGGALAVSAAQSVSLADAAGAVARCLMGAGPLCAAGTAAAVAYGVYRYANESGTFRFDPGEAPSSCPTEYAFSGTGWFCSWDSAIAAKTASLNAAGAGTCLVGSTWTDVTYTYLYSTGHAGATWRRSSCNGSPTSEYYFSASSRAGSGSYCDGSIDPLDSQYSVAPGAPVGPDGLCPTARYYHTPATESQAVASVAAYPSAVSPGAWIDAVKDAIALGLAELPAKLSTSGPATQTGTPWSSTVTGPGGTTTTTTTPTYSYTYAGDTITYSTSNSTQTCVGAEACTTTIENPPPPSEDQDDPCVTDPTRAGCVHLGEPTDSELDTDSRSVSIAPAGSFGASDAACPSPRTVTLTSGLELALPFDLVCQFAVGIRPVVLGLAYLSAVAAFLGLARRGSA